MADLVASRTTSFPAVFGELQELIKTVGRSILLCPQEGKNKALLEKGTLGQSFKF